MRDGQEVIEGEKKPKVSKAKAIALYKGGMATKDIAEEFGVTRGAISHLIRRNEANKDLVQTFRDNKPEIMEGIQAELLSRVNGDNPKEAQSLIVGAGILEDKIRLSRGESTENVAVVHKLAYDYMKQRVTEMDTE